MWQIINTGSMDAQKLMDLDKAFLETVQKPTLHFYRFKGPSLTYGLLMKIQEHLDLEALSRLKINKAIRPTGGGALFHMWDLAFSVIIPLSYIPHIKTTLDRYLAINQLTEMALEPFLDQTLRKEFLSKTPEGKLGERFCMAKPTQYDVMIAGKKCVGAAQRVTKDTLLHQATVSLCAPDEKILKEVLFDKDVAAAMLEQSFYLDTFPYTDHLKLTSLQNALEKSLEKTFQDHYTELFKI